MTLKQKLVIYLLLVLTAFLFVTPILAQQTPILSSDAANELEIQNNAFVSQTGLNELSIGVIVAYGIRILLSLLGLIFIVLIIYAGFLWMTSAGNEENISKAKKIMTAAVIGLVIVLSAYAITIFVIDRLLFNTGASGGTSTY